MMVSSRKWSKAGACQAGLVIRMSIVNDMSTTKLKSEAVDCRKVCLGSENTSGRGSYWIRLLGLECIEIAEMRKMDQVERVTWASICNFDMNIALDKP